MFREREENCLVVYIKFFFQFDAICTILTKSMGITQNIVWEATVAAYLRSLIVVINLLKRNCIAFLEHSWLRNCEKMETVNSHLD